MEKQKGISSTMIIAAAVFIIVVLVFLFLPKRSAPPTETQQPSRATSEIQNGNDLNTAMSELDNTNVDEIDTQLNQIRSDASSF